MSPTGVVKKIEQCPECHAAVEERVASTEVRHRHGCSYEQFRSAEQLEAAIADRAQQERDRMAAAVSDRFNPAPADIVLFICKTCGSVVLDRERHIGYHESLNKTASQARDARSLLTPLG